MKITLADTVAEVNTRVYSDYYIDADELFEKDLIQAIKKEYGLNDTDANRQFQLAEQIWSLDGKISVTEQAESLAELFSIKHIEKPYILGIQCYSGYYKLVFKHLEQVQKAFSKYKEEAYYEDGANYGVYYYKVNKDGSKELLDYEKLDVWFNLDGLFDAKVINDLK